MIEEAAPALVDPTSFGLTDSRQNRLMLEKLEKKKGRKIGKIKLGTQEEIPLVKTGGNEGSIYAAYQGKLVVYIQFHEYHYSFLPVKTITQTALWRDPTLPVSNQFSPNLFFGIILKQTTAVLSDNSHTPDGTEFWMRRSREALLKGLNVALVDFGKRTYQQFTIPLELEHALHESWFGGLKTSRSKQLRWAIWK